MLDDEEEEGTKFDRKYVKDAAFKQALKDSKDSTNTMVFTYNMLMSAGGDKIRAGCRSVLKSQVEMAEMMLNAHKLQEKRNKPKKEKRDF